MNLFIRLYKSITTTLTLISLSLMTFIHAAPININSADVSMIVENLTDIGPAKATAIVEYRTLNGPFATAQDLLMVKGIGEKTLEKNRDNLLFDTPSSDLPEGSSIE